MFDGHYINWNHKKVKGIIDYYGHKNFYFKTVLDLGCGYGDIGAAFSRLGADVTIVDGRSEHLNIAKTKYPHLKRVQADLDNEWPFKNKKFDFILDLALLCHLKNWQQHLVNVCSSCNHLVLETEVLDSNDENQSLLVEENRSVYDWSLNGIGSRPSAANIEKVLRTCGMSFKRLDDAKFNSEPYKYDWQNKNDGQRKFGLRRIWFATKSAEVQPEAIWEIIEATAKEIAPEAVTESSNKRLAICLSGYLKDIEKTFNSLDKNINLSNRDFFMYIWNERDISKNTERLNSFKQDIVSIYNPKKIIIEDNNLGVAPFIHDLYAIYKCNDLKSSYEKENKFTYDYVLRMNASLELLDKLNINSFDEKAIYIPNTTNDLECDVNFALSSSRLMDIYSFCWDYLDEYNLNLVSANVYMRHHLSNFNAITRRMPVRLSRTK